ncbi:DUF2924 domain-containing protein [Ruegeria sp. Alg231-54]|uniref:DUF2924 domain-containing protein n=1 Tax=Ruegeria sp. Alg231-54 TaxID=1922221 RepID=UPI000D55132D|nr:DUF2924 domain-containing protein [Ruegeria sp. Alg231-54]
MTVAEIEGMDRAALTAAWSDIFRTPVPRGLSKVLLRRFLAIEIQTRQMGGLSKKAKTALRKPSDQTARPQSPGLQPGGRLLREWNGVTHVVDVTDDGFVWKENRYRSLSRIAREITGAHWSGPRFFGLNGAAKS